MIKLKKYTNHIQENKHNTYYNKKEIIKENKFWINKEIYLKNSLKFNKSVFKIHNKAIFYKIKFYNRFLNKNNKFKNSLKSKI